MQLDLKDQDKIDPILKINNFNQYLSASFVRKKLPRYPSLIVVLMSTAMAINVFQNFFGTFRIEGKSYPVTQFFFEDVLVKTKFLGDNNVPPSELLKMFGRRYKDVNICYGLAPNKFEVCFLIRARAMFFLINIYLFYILKLHSSMQSFLQDRVFLPSQSQVNVKCHCVTMTICIFLSISFNFRHPQSSEKCIQSSERNRTGGKVLSGWMLPLVVPLEEFSL